METYGLSNTIVSTVVANAKNKATAQAMLKSIAHESKQEQLRGLKRKIQELESMFPSLANDLGRASIMQVLEACNWDVDAAIEPLFKKVQSDLEEGLRQEAERQRKESLDRKRTQANEYLQQLFTTVDTERINVLLNKNQGDVDATVEQLLDVVMKQDAEKKHKEPEPPIQKEPDFDFDSASREVIERQRAIEKAILEDQKRREQEEQQKVIEEEQLRQRQYEKEVEIKKQQELQAKLEREQQEREARLKAQQEALKTQERHLKVQKMLAEAEKKRVEEEQERKLLEIQAAQELFREDLEEKIRTQPPPRPPAPVKEKKQEEDDSSDKDAQKPVLSSLLLSPDQVPSLPGPLGLPSSSAEAKADSTVHVPIVGLEEVDSIEDDFELIEASAELNQVDHVKLTVSLDEAHQQRTAVNVSWTTNLEQGPSDWIGLFHAPQKTVSASFLPEQSTCLAWQWVSHAVRTDGVSSLSLQSPSSYPCGSVVCSYYTKSGSNYYAAAVSPAIHIGPVYEISAGALGFLSANADEKDQRSVKAQRDLEVYITAQTGSLACPNAWVALYEHENKEHRDYSTWQWVSAGQPVPSEETKTRIVLKTPRCGMWQVRMFPFRSYHPAVRTQAVLQGEDNVSMHVQPENAAVLNLDVCVWTVSPATQSVWVGVYFVSEKRPRWYRRYQYVSELGANRLSFKTPIHKGDYVARLWVQGRDEPLAESNVISLPDRL